MKMDSSNSNLYVILLHAGMVDKANNSVTTSLTLNDIQDIARSCRTYGVKQFFVAHPAPSLQRLATRIRMHWEQGYGSTYNTKRKEAFSTVKLVADLEEALFHIDNETGKNATLVATSAKDGSHRVQFAEFSKTIKETDSPYLLMLGTGWGMGDELMHRANLTLQPIKGPTPFNHLSVRAACAIMLDKILS